MVYHLAFHDLRGPHLFFMERFTAVHTCPQQRLCHFLIEALFLRNSYEKFVEVAQIISCQVEGYILPSVFSDSSAITLHSAGWGVRCILQSGLVSLSLLGEV